MYVEPIFLSKLLIQLSFKSTVRNYARLVNERLSSAFYFQAILPCRLSPLGLKARWRLCDIPGPRQVAHGRHQGRTTPIHPANNIIVFK